MEDNKFLCCSIPWYLMTAKSVRLSVLKKVTEYIAYQHKIWAEGTFPKIDFYGKPLAGYSKDRLFKCSYREGR